MIRLVEETDIHGKYPEDCRAYLNMECCPYYLFDTMVNAQGSGFFMVTYTGGERNSNVC